MTTDNITVEVNYTLEEDRGLACMILENHLLYQLRVGEIQDGTDEDNEWGKTRVVYFEAPREGAVKFLEELDEEKRDG